MLANGNPGIIVLYLRWEVSLCSVFKLERTIPYCLPEERN
jgi:hypothetical protein